MKIADPIRLTNFQTCRLVLTNIIHMNLVANLLETKLLKITSLETNLVRSVSKADYRMFGDLY